MFCEPLARTFHEKPVKPVVGDGFLDIAHIGGRKTEFEEAKRKINKIPFSEYFHQWIAVGLVGPYLVVHLDHQANFLMPSLLPRFG